MLVRRLSSRRFWAIPHLLTNNRFTSSLQPCKQAILAKSPQANHFSSKARVFFFTRLCILVVAWKEGKSNVAVEIVIEEWVTDFTFGRVESTSEDNWKHGKVICTKTTPAQQYKPPILWQRFDFWFSFSCSVCPLTVSWNSFHWYEAFSVLDMRHSLYYCAS